MHLYDFEFVQSVRFFSSNDSVNSKNPENFDQIAQKSAKTKWQVTDYQLKPVQKYFIPGCAIFKTTLKNVYFNNAL